MAYFKHLVIELKIPPSEFWLLDYREIATLTDANSRIIDTDISMMINSQRKSNGAKSEYLIK